MESRSSLQRQHIPSQRNKENSLTPSTNPLLIFTPPSGTGKVIFLAYLWDVAVLLTNPIPPASNRRLICVARKMDHFLPFRDWAPTPVKSMDILYSDKEYLRTQKGFWNVLIFRAVFYGAPFALNDLHL